MTNREKVREQIAYLFFDSEYPGFNWGDHATSYDRERCFRWADAILALPDIEVRTENQTLPEIPSFAYDKEDERPLLIRGAINYSKLFTDWVKCETQERPE